MAAVITKIEFFGCASDLGIRSPILRFVVQLPVTRALMTEYVHLKECSATPQKVSESVTAAGLPLCCPSTN